MDTVQWEGGVGSRLVAKKHRQINQISDMNPIIPKKIEMSISE
jgi:hypothetical protein